MLTRANQRGFILARVKRILKTTALAIALLGSLAGCMDFGPYKNPLILEDSNGQTVLELKNPYFRSGTKDTDGYSVVCANLANNFEYGFDYTGSLSASSASLVGYTSGTEKPVSDFSPAITQTGSSVKVSFSVPVELTPQSITVNPPNPPLTYLKLFVQSGNVSKYLYSHKLEVKICR